MKCAAKEVVPHTPWIYPNAHQLKAMLVLARKRAQAIDIKVCITNLLYYINVTVLWLLLRIFFLECQLDTESKSTPDKNE